MAAQRKYPEELRERAVKMVFEVREREGKGHGEPPECRGSRYGESENVLAWDLGSISRWALCCLCAAWGAVCPGGVPRWDGSVVGPGARARLPPSGAAVAWRRRMPLPAARIGDLGADGDAVRLAGWRVLGDLLPREAQGAGEPGGQVPVGRAGQVHDGGQQHAADEDRVDEDGEGEAEAEFLEQVVPAGQERAEDHDHDPGGGGGDDAGAVGLA